MCSCRHRHSGARRIARRACQRCLYLHLHRPRATPPRPWHLLLPSIRPHRSHVLVVSRHRALYTSLHLFLKCRATAQLCPCSRSYVLVLHLPPAYLYLGLSSTSPQPLQIHLSRATAHLSLSWLVLISLLACADTGKAMCSQQVLAQNGRYQAISSYHPKYDA